MARDKILQPNIDNSDPVNFPNGRIRDDSGANDGTRITEANLGDVHEFVAKLMRLANIAFNNVSDSEGNGYQYIQALREFADKNDFLYNVSTDLTDIQIPVKWNQMQDGEFLVCQAGFDFTTETGVTGTLDAIPGSFPATFIGGAFSSGEYLRIIKTVAGADVIRLSEGREVFAADIEGVIESIDPGEGVGAKTVSGDFLTGAVSANGADYSVYNLTFNDIGTTNYRVFFELTSLGGVAANIGVIYPLVRVKTSTSLSFSVYDAASAGVNNVDITVRISVI